MDDADDFEVVFKAQYQLPVLKDIPKNPYVTCYNINNLKKGDYKELESTQGRSTQMMRLGVDCVCSCVRSSARDVSFADSILVVFGPVPKSKEIKATLVAPNNHKLELDIVEVRTEVKGQYNYPFYVDLNQKGCYLVDPDDFFDSVDFGEVDELCRIHEFTILIEAHFDPSSQMVLVHHNEIREGKDLGKDLENFLESESHSDVTFIVKGEKIKAHKAILAARSEYFSRMFASGMKECQTSEVQMDDCDPLTFRKTLQILYGGFKFGSQVDFKTAVGVFALVDRYQLTGIAKSCLEVIRERTNAENVALVLKAASDLNNEDLRRISFDVLKEMSEKDRWQILVDLGDGEMMHNFLVTLVTLVTL